MEHELRSNILPFWTTHAVDRRYGGIVGEISSELQVKPDADKGLVLHARILWTYAAAYRTYHLPIYWQMAESAYQYLQTTFLDREYGGYYWMLKADGTPKIMKKQIYGQAFVIYALAEYVRAGAGVEVVEEAIDLFHSIERAAYDREHGGYVEALSRDWEETDDLRLSENDLNARKSMNTHLHIMEAYTNLYRLVQPDLLKKRLTALVHIMLEQILDEEHRHLRLFFDDGWAVRSDVISYGHDIEASWLLVEAAEVLGDPDLLAQVKSAAIRIAESTLEEGVDGDGALIYEANSSGWTVTDKIWWAQAEAVVGFWNAYELTRETCFAEAAYNTWRFIDEYLVDRKHGEWYWKTDRFGAPDLAVPKVDPWKCPYHNGRMGMEMALRLSRALDPDG